MTHTGLIPNSDLSKNSFVLSASSRAFDNLTISTNVNFSQTGADNRPSSNRGTNPLEWAYQMPNNVDIKKFKDYWVPGKEGLEVVNFSPELTTPIFWQMKLITALTGTRYSGNGSGLADFAFVQYNGTLFTEQER
jgi:hypothetical protein